MNFEEVFSEWLAKNLRDDIPKSVKGFSFNLFEFEPIEDVSIKFGITLIGSESFDESDEDWACDEIWIPRARELLIPTDYSGNNWKECLARMKNLILSKLQSNDRSAKRLKEAKGIGIGFVDGDLEVIYRNPSSTETVNK
jgi:hypothetical protein